MSTTYLAMCDWQQSVLGDGQVGRRYTPYGALPQVAGPRLAYCGMPCEVLTGNYSPGNGHRTYDPLLKRFHSPDRLSPFGGGGINAYAYCSGDPINREDRNGRIDGFIFAAKAAATVGGVLSPLTLAEGAAAINMTIARAKGGDNAPTISQIALQVGVTIYTGATDVVSFAVLSGFAPKSAYPGKTHDKGQKGITARGVIIMNALAVPARIVAFKNNKKYYPGFGVSDRSGETDKPIELKTILRDTDIESAANTNNIDRG